MKDPYYDERDADHEVRMAAIKHETMRVFVEWDYTPTPDRLSAFEQKIAERGRALSASTERARLHQREGGSRNAYYATLSGIEHMRSAQVYRAALKGKEWAERVPWQEALAKYEAETVLQALTDLRLSLEQGPKTKVRIDWFPSQQNYRSIVRFGYQGLITRGAVENGGHTYCPCVLSFTTNPRLAVDMPITIHPDNPLHSLEAAKMWVAKKFEYVEELSART